MNKDMYEKLSGLSRSEFTSNTASNLGRKFSEEHRKRISMAQKGKAKSAETKQKLAISNAGNKPTKFAREYASLVHKGVAKSSSHRNKIGQANSKKISTPVGILNSINQVASVYKVSRVTVHNWLKKRDSGFCYVDKNAYLKRIQTPLGVFNNINEVAIAYDVGQGTVHNWLKRNKEGFSRAM
jgi:hypothetical protein